MDKNKMSILKKPLTFFLEKTCILKFLKLSNNNNKYIYSYLGQSSINAYCSSCRIKLYIK